MKISYYDKPGQTAKLRYTRQWTRAFEGIDEGWSGSVIIMINDSGDGFYVETISQQQYNFIKLKLLSSIT